MICCRLVHVSSINKISKIIQVMSSFMVGSVRIYGWSELTILSHRCCLWHWVYRMSAFTTHWFLKLLGYIYIYTYIYICHYHCPHDISTYYNTYIYINIYIYILTHTHTKKNKRKHVEQISITAVWSSQITVVKQVPVRLALDAREHRKPLPPVRSPWPPALALGAFHSTSKCAKD